VESFRPARLGMARGFGRRITGAAGSYLGAMRFASGSPPAVVLECKEVGGRTGWGQRGAAGLARAAERRGIGFELPKRRDRRASLGDDRGDRESAARHGIGGAEVPPAFVARKSRRAALPRAAIEVRQRKADGYRRHLWGSFHGHSGLLRDMQALGACEPDLSRWRALFFKLSQPGSPRPAEFVPNDGAAGRRQRHLFRRPVIKARPTVQAPGGQLAAPAAPCHSTARTATGKSQTIANIIAHIFPRGSAC